MPEANDILDEFLRRELETMQIYLFSKASRTAISIEEYIDSRLAQGATRESIEKYLLDDLNNNGRIFAEFRNSIKATTNGVIARSRDNALFSEYGVDEKYRWVAVLVNTCPDCLDRHGLELFYSQWEEIGLPRTGTTVCKENCKCMLLPADTTILEPLQRNKR